MPEQVVSLEKSEWQTLLQVLGMAQGPGISWSTVNPLLMRIGSQLQSQEQPPANFPQPGDGLDADPPDIGLQQAARRVPRN